MSLTRTLKFEVRFPGYRRADLIALWSRLHKTQRDLSTAANHAINAMYLTERGALSLPPSPKGDGKPIHPQTLAYQAFSGKWQPFDNPCYDGGDEKVGSCVLTEIANNVASRLKTDLKDIRSGKKSLSTFKSIPISMPAAKCEINPDTGHLTFHGMWSRGRGKGDVTVRPEFGSRDSGSKAIWNNLRLGHYKLGSTKLFYDDRRRKWFCAVSWTDKAHTLVPVGERVCGIDLGMIDTARLAYTDLEGNILPERDVFRMPRNVIRAFERQRKELNERCAMSRAEFPHPEGRGYARRVRGVETLRGRKGRMTDTMIAQLAAGIVNKAKSRGATILALEDLKGFTDETMKNTERKSGKAKKAARKKFLDWNSAALREKIKQVAEREGLTTIEVNQAYTSKTCVKCGKVYTSTDPDRVHSRLGHKVEVVKPHDGFGRNGRDFKCECGYTENADHNGALNIARRALYERKKS